jgi:hypothetical protein
LLILSDLTFDHGYFRRMTSSMCDLPFFESFRHFSPEPAAQEDTGVCLRLLSHDTGMKQTLSPTKPFCALAAISVRGVNVGTKMIVLPMDRRADNMVGKRS